MLARVTCAECGEYLGTYEKELPSSADVELYREYAVCTAGHHSKILEINLAEVPPPEPEPVVEPEEPPKPWYQIW